MSYKVIDAKDGAVTKFEYEGATFKAVEGREPDTGDYLVITDEASARILDGVTVGKPYLIENIDRHDDYVFTDDDGDRRYPGKGEYSHAIYEKIDPPKTTITHEGRAYKLVGRKAQPGDAVYVTEKAVGTGAVPNDRVYIVDKNGMIGSRGWTYPVYKSMYNRTESTVYVYEPVATQKRLIYRDSEGVTHTVLDAELVAYSSVEEDE